MTFKEFLRESNIDKEKVTDAANKIAKEVFGDKVDSDKVNGMIDKAIKLAKDTEDAIGIFQSFFKD
jgi:F0F1-type ATP synthase membrane subunit b/b'